MLALNLAAWLGSFRIWLSFSLLFFKGSHLSFQVFVIVSIVFYPLLQIAQLCFVLNV